METVALLLVLLVIGLVHLVPAFLLGLCIWYISGALYRMLEGS